jgi:hypothetical protein
VRHDCPRIRRRLTLNKLSDIGQEVGGMRLSRFHASSPSTGERTYNSLSYLQHTDSTRRDVERFFTKVATRDGQSADSRRRGAVPAEKGFGTVLQLKYQIGIE